jgi:ABC-2 type transport system ATP-binding protein
MDEAEYADRVSVMRAGRLIALDSPAGLKALLPAGTLWEVEVADLLGAVEPLGQLAGVDEVTLHGTLLHLRTAAPATAKALTAAIRTAGVALRHIEPVPATLEDVFIALTGPAGA